MSVLVAQSAPNFTAEAVLPDRSFANVSLSDYRGKYVLLFFWPLDFTFVCPTEIIAFSEAFKEFEKLNTQLLGCSIDSVYTHLAWSETPRSRGGLGGMAFPLLSDLRKTISADYGVLLAEQGVALRGLFVIDKKGTVQHELVNNLQLGRSVPEALRAIRELQFTEKYGEVCPANWQEGESGIKTDPTESRAYFEKTYGPK